MSPLRDMDVAFSNARTQVSEVRWTVRLGARALLGGLALLALQSVFWGDRLPLSMQAGLASLAILSFVRPEHGALVVAGVGPLGGLLARAWGTPTVSLTEAVVLAFLAGWLLGSRPSTGQARWPCGTPALLLGVAIAVSWLVTMTATPRSFSPALWSFLTREYLVMPVDYLGLRTAAWLIEGLGLLASVTLLAVHSRQFAQRLILAIVVGGLVVAAASVARQTPDELVGEPRAPAPIGETTALDRSSVHVRDFNAAGSHFAMVALMAIGLAAARRRWRTGWLSVALVIGAALWLTGSRAAIAAIAAVLLVAACARAVRLRSAPALLVAAGCLLLVIAVGASVLVPAAKGFAGVGPAAALTTRAEFTKTSLRMLATRPALGIGIGQYYWLSGRFMTADLKKSYSLENAHNYFLQLAVELGAIGLGFFVWLIGSALRPALAGMQVDRGEGGSKLAGVVGGVVAFLLTCLTGHPLLVPEVAFSFWMALGVAAVLGAQRTAAASGGAWTAAGPGNGMTWRSKGRRGVTAALLLALLLSLPFRVNVERREAEFVDLSVGFFDPRVDETGRTFRRIRDRATFHVTGGIRELGIPMRPIADAHVRVDEVAILLNGRPVDRVRFVDDRWIDVRLPLPPLVPGTRFQRIDFFVQYRRMTSSELARPYHPGTEGLRVGDIAVTGRR